MGIFEQIAELTKRDAIEEGRKEGAEEATYRFVENLLKDSGFPLEKIADMANVSLEKVKKIRISLYIEKLAKNKEKEILKECRAKYYCEEYSITYTRNYIESYKVGLLVGIQLAACHLVEGPESIEPPGERVV
jgi:hypothetical protein